MATTKPSSAQIEFVPTSGPTTDVQTALREVIDAGVGGGADDLVIAVIGASVSDSHTARTNSSWPFLLEQYLNIAGDRVKVHNYAIGGYTAQLMMTSTVYGGTTQVQKVINAQPQIVIIDLGFNDVGGADPIATVQANMLGMIQAIKAGVPGVKVVFAQERIYDATNFATTTNLKNKGTIPFLFQLQTAGPTASTYCTSMLEDQVSATMKSNIDRLNTLNAYIAARPEVDGTFVNDYWRVARLGCLLPDSLHPNFMGMQLVAHNMLAGLLTCPSAITNLIPKFKATGPNTVTPLDILFTGMMEQVGDGWAVKANPTLESTFSAKEFPGIRKVNPEGWFYPSGTRFGVHGPSGPNSPVMLVIRNGPPNSQVYFSPSGTGFVAANNITDSDGFAILEIADGQASSGNLVKVGNEVYGPFTVTTADTVVAELNGDLTLGLSRPAETRTIRLRSSGTGALYDAAIESSGGSVSAGNGTLTLRAANTEVTGNFNANAGVTTTNVNASGAVTAGSVTAPVVQINGIGITTGFTAGLGTYLTFGGSTFGVLPGLGVAPILDNAYSCGGFATRWTTIWATSGVVSTSDKRDKTAIRKETLGLSFINKLTPVTYRWKKGKDTERTYHGLIAQDVEKALEGQSFAGLEVPQGKKGRYGVRYTEFLAPLIKAVQELSAQNEELKARIETLERL